MNASIGHPKAPTTNDQAIIRADGDRLKIICLGLSVALSILVVPHFPRRQNPVAMESARRTVDPNLVSWWELTTLPRIGPVLAQRIVDHRESVRRDRSLASHAHVFTQTHDLLAVRGIGPKTLRRIAPHLEIQNN